VSFLSLSTCARPSVVVPLRERPPERSCPCSEAPARAFAQFPFFSLQPTKVWKSWGYFANMLLLCPSAAVRSLDLLAANGVVVGPATFRFLAGLDEESVKAVVSALGQGTKQALAQASKLAGERKIQLKIQQVFLNPNIPEDVMHQSRRTQAEVQKIVADRSLGWKGMSMFTVNLGQSKETLHPPWSIVKGAPFWDMEKLEFQGHRSRLARPVLSLAVDHDVDKAFQTITIGTSDTGPKGQDYDRCILLTSLHHTLTDLPPQFTNRSYTHCFVDIPKGVLCCWCCSVAVPIRERPPERSCPST
jgi:hypothetical protein